MKAEDHIAGYGDSHRPIAAAHVKDQPRTVTLKVFECEPVAIITEWRRRGVATALLEAADLETLAAGGRRVVLHAQTYARKLYESCGYRPRGRKFWEAGIEHIAMEKHLD